MPMNSSDDNFTDRSWIAFITIINGNGTFLIVFAIVLFSHRKIYFRELFKKNIFDSNAKIP